MAYVIELPTGILALTFEPSLFDTERAALDPLKAQIPHGFPGGRQYIPKEAPRNSRMWMIASPWAATVQEIMREAGVWLAWITIAGANVFIPGPVPITMSFHYEDNEYDPNALSYSDLINDIDGGAHGKEIAARIMAGTDLLEVLADHGSKAVDGQLALDLARADGKPAPRVKPQPKPPIDEAGELAIAYIMRLEDRNDPRVQWGGTSPNPKYRFSLITNPDNFCGTLKRDQLIVWAERTENATMQRLSIPGSIDAQSHYTALAMERVAGKWPTRAEARAAFGIQSKIYHPDYNKSENANAMFAPVLAAWEFFKRATEDKTGRIFKMYEASLKIRNGDDGTPHPKMIEPLVDERLTAPYLSSNVMCGLLTGTWTRNESTGEIVIKTIEDIKPLTDSKGRHWLPTLQPDQTVAGEWITVEEYETRPLVDNRQPTGPVQYIYPH